MHALAPVSRTIATTTHGRFTVRGTGQRAVGLLLAFHGYAQNAELFAADLDAIPGADAWLVVSVQALNRFYTKSGDVVASWMTRQDRDLAIADNLAYVRSVVARVRAMHAREIRAGDRPVFLGFSQGAAMAFRAAAAHGEDCAGVIALGGEIPPEIRATTRPLPPALLGRGRADEWYTQEKLTADTAWLRDTGTSFVLCEYDGGHGWTDPFRREAAAFLERLARIGVD